MLRCCCRPPKKDSPLFLAAPGVANAQAAYFAFANFLAWSDQPIYVLEKDNDLTVAQLAQKNAADILTVQPTGPFLLGGHSYGGFRPECTLTNALSILQPASPIPHASWHKTLLAFVNLQLLLKFAINGAMPSAEPEPKHRLHRGQCWMAVPTGSK